MFYAGLISGLVPMYIGEIAPTTLRGAMKESGVSSIALHSGKQAACPGKNQTPQWLTDRVL